MPLCSGLISDRSDVTIHAPCQKIETATQPQHGCLMAHLFPCTATSNELLNILCTCTSKRPSPKLVFAFPEMTGLCFALISSLHLHRHIHVDHTQTCHGNTKMGLERSLHQGKENPIIKRLNRLSDKTMRTEFLKIPSMEQWLRLDCSPDLLQDIKRPNTLY